MNSNSQTLIITDHAYVRYLQRYIGNNLSKVELESLLNEVKAERVQGFGEEVLLIDSIYWCYCLRDDGLILLTTCLGNYDLFRYHIWERRQSINLHNRLKRLA